MNGRSIGFVRPLASLLLLAGSLTIFCGPVLAEQGQLAQFRASHADMSGREARQLYHSLNSDNRLPREDRLSAKLEERIENRVSSTQIRSSDIQVLRRHDLNLQRRTTQLTDRGEVGLRAGVDFDLSSIEANVVIGSKLLGPGSSIKITVGGMVKEVNAGDHVTASEYLAVKQVLATGHQDIQMNSKGAAVGGQFDLSQISSRNDQVRADDFVIPENVIGYADLGRKSTFQVEGDLTNSGSLIALPSETRRHTGIVFGARSILNNSGAIISTSPVDSGAMTDATIDLTLLARNNVENYGTISSSGDLTISAGEIVVNHSGGTVSSSAGVSLEAPSLVNAGLIESQNSSVQIDSVGTLNVDNRDGVIGAAQGAIALRGQDYRGSFDTNLVGGDLLSREFNVNAGQGTANIDVRKLTGKLNQTGFASHVSSITDELVLGQICLTGDPTIKNVGDITLTGDLVVGEALTIISSGSISSIGDLSIIVGDNTSGFPLTIVAGANITTGGADTPSIPPVGAGVATSINGASATGGRIDFDNSGSVTISTRSTSLTGNRDGGDVILAAFEGSTAGAIDLDGSSIFTGGVGTGSNGNVTFIANTIFANLIDTTGSTNTLTGAISLQGAQPANGVVSWAANGQLTAGSLSAGSFAASTGVVVTSDLTAGALIDLRGEIVGVVSGNLRTVNPFGSISIEGLDTSTSRDTVEFALGSTAFTASLLLNSADNIASIRTNASFISAQAVGAISNFISVNPEPVVFSGSAGNFIDANFVGSVVSDSINPVIAPSRLTLISAEGSIGLAANSPLIFASNIIELQAPKGNVFVQSAGGTTFRGGTQNIAGGTYSLVVGSNLSAFAGAEISGKRVVLNSSGNLNLVGSYSATESMSITSDGIINNATISGTLTTPSLTVTSLSQSIGTDAATRFNAGIGVKAVEAISLTDSVFLAAPALKTFTLAGGFAQNRFDYLGTGSTTVSKDITSQALVAGDGLFLRTGTGTLTVGSGVNLLSQRDLLLAVTAPTAQASKSKIIVGKNATIITSSNITGDVTISIGDPGAPVLGVKPKNVSAATTTGGTIFFGAAGLKAKSPSNTLFATNGANLIINNPIKSNNISLGGGVVIVADQ